MTNTLSALADLSDNTLLDRIKHLAEHERRATVDLVGALSEMDSRRLYLGQGCSSLFTYCTQVLRLSEHAAYRRIEAARAARRFPAILDLLNEGAINLTTIGLLISHLTPENHREVLASASHKSKRAVEQLVAGLRPQPAAPVVVRRLPSPRLPDSVNGPARVSIQAAAWSAPLDHAPASPPVVVTPARRAVVTALAPESYKIQCTISRETHDKLRRAQDLLRHAIPNGDPANIIDRALTLLLAALEKQKFGATSRPRTIRTAANGTSRVIPASVRRKVWARDGGQCAFVGTTGRCTERGFLEFHHVEPFAAGGKAKVENLSLRCRAHNAYESELFFGPLTAREARESWHVQLVPDRNELSVETASIWVPTTPNPCRPVRGGACPAREEHR